MRYPGFTPRAILVAVFLVLSPFPCLPEAAPAEQGGGFYLKSGEYNGMELRLGGGLQLDYRYYAEEESKATRIRAINKASFKQRRAKSWVAIKQGLTVRMIRCIVRHSLDLALFKGVVEFGSHLIREGHWTQASEQLTSALGQVRMCT